LIQRFRSLFIGAVCALALAASPVHAQTNSFKQTNLVSDTVGVAPGTDQDLNNPWGVAFLPNQPFQMANNQGGTSKAYDRNGVSRGTFVVPPPRGSSIAESALGTTIGHLSFIQCGRIVV
jgi:secreted PhoX family phosphatase